MILYETPQTKNPAYIRARAMTPVGILVHSTGATNTTLKRWVDAPEYLGKNIFNNHWNKSTAKKSMHGFVGRDKDGNIAVCHTQPYNTACWGCGSGNNGSYNRDPTGHVQFEICEDNAPRSKKPPTAEQKQFYQDAIKVAEDYCVYLCKLLNLNASNITSHYEAHDLGYASNHGDPRHWMRLYNDSMDKFRERVAERLKGNDSNPEPQDTEAEQPRKISETIVKLKITREENATFFGKSIGDVIELPLDEYLLGVVPAEIGNPHIEAAKAQAVAARTYAYTKVVGGGTIDDTTTYQAYRAPRSTSKSYPNAHQGVRDTAGQLLLYNGEVIATSVYSHSNGGTTVSAKERWGSDRPYLIAKDDKWTKASGVAKNGHGVGMSQAGAKWAADNGIGYEEILSFYYPGTTITEKWVIPEQPKPDPEEPVTPPPAPISDALYRAEVVTKQPKSLNIWREARKGVSLIMVPKGAYVDVLEEVDKTWAKVRFAGIIGYSDRQYLKKEGEQINILYTAVVKTKYPLSLNIWKEARKGVSLGKIPNGETVDVLEEVDSTWAKIRYKNTIGFSDRKYLIE